VKALKVLLIGGGLVLVAGVMATAGLVYVAYRVKGKVERAAQELTAGAGASHASSSRAEAPVRRIDPCTLLTREEASEILGVAVERTEPKDGPSESSCRYFAKPRSQQERATSVAAAFTSMTNNADRPLPRGKENDPSEVVRRTGMGDLMKGIGGLVNPDAPCLGVSVNWEEGRAAFSVLKLTIAANSPGISTTEDLAGIGDQALMGPVDIFLAFVKGRTGVQIDLSQVPQGRDKGVAMARKIASRL
jgi:hypothetical protein